MGVFHERSKELGDLNGICDDGGALPFLADPVVSEIFKNKEVAGVGLAGLINAEQALIANVIKGDKWAGIAKKMPRVIGVNLLEFDLRKTGTDFHQVAELVYREEPRELASGRFMVHNIQLPRFRKIEADLSNELHVFLKAVCRSQEWGKTLKEAIKMDADLAESTKNITWIQELSDRHEIASANRMTRDVYFKWLAETNLMELEAALRHQELLRVVAEKESEIAVMNDKNVVLNERNAALSDENAALRYKLAVAGIE